MAAAPTPTAARFVDIGANLLDSMFAGSYRGKQAHEADLDAVLARAAACGVQHAIVTAGTLEESRLALELVRRQRAGGCPVRLHSTVGVHPTRCLDFLPEAERAEIEAAMAAAADGGGGGEETLAAIEAEVLARPSVMAAIEAHAQALRRLLSQGREEGLVAAIGECGLDYDRLHFCPRLVQRAGFAAQLGLATEGGPPLFLHSRAARGEFAAMCKERRGAVGAAGGVVHSFDGDAAELEQLLSLGLEIGINGCSLKTEANLAVAARVPLGRLHLETDAPWCGVGEI